MSQFTLYEGNCLKIMREMKSESVDCVIIDPPFSGFGLQGKPEDYWKVFHFYYNEMKRLCRGERKRLAVSQPPARHDYLVSRMEMDSILEIDDCPHVPR